MVPTDKFLALMTFICDMTFPGDFVMKKLKDREEGRGRETYIEGDNYVQSEWKFQLQFLAMATCRGEDGRRCDEKTRKKGQKNEREEEEEEAM